MKRRILTSAILILTLCWNASAQLQVGQGINDFYNKLPEVHNLALIPLTSVPSVSLIAGSRMDGFGRHPMQGTLLCSGFLIDRLGAGMKVNYEKMGLLTKTDIQLGLTYYVFISKESTTPQLNSEGSIRGGAAGDKFSFFLAGHFIQDKINKNDIVVLNPGDPVIQDISDFAPNGNASAGIAFLRENKYYAGISAYQLFHSRSEYLNPEWKNIKRMHYYITGSYTFNLNTLHNLELELLAIGALVDFHAYQWEGGVEFKAKKMFTVGAAYRSNGVLKFDAGVIAQSWNFGYCFSYAAFTDANKYTYKGINNMIFIRKIFNEGRRSSR
jgi:type IX secretion system PorP/SprF family membrane protein